MSETFGVVFGPTAMVVGIEGKEFAAMTFCTASQAARGMSDMCCVMFSNEIVPTCAAGKVIGIGFCTRGFEGVAAAAGVLLCAGAGVTAVDDVDVFLAPPGYQMRQTNFLPSLSQTNLVPGVSSKVPTFLQVLPTLGAAALTLLTVEPIIRAVATTRTTYVRNFDMRK